ncbi:hypothetical protein L1987_28750 [Smallanthus sonchifolius]|uniref:Uncharacterized protein n=1 Tax=Smallanthus sonchifolius TaxID=185202 RepID=A0ACB9HZA7_9ASTR|nr:hypothetical protein L1987_28750 [Smallanthus sonchifolius]
MADSQPTSSPIPKWPPGSYAQPNNIPLYGHVLVAKDISNDSSKPTLTSPIDYTLVWSSESLDTEKDGEGYVWLPVAPDGYKAVGYIITGSSAKPPVDKVGCVSADFTDTPNTTVGLEKDQYDLDGLNVYGSIGGFRVRNESVGNLKGNLSNSMPNLNQINALIQAYSPVIYFHPDEQFLPSSVDWFFQKGALVYHKGNESKPSLIESNGSNLPQGGSNDDTYWLDLPLDGSSKDRVKKGDLQDACAYFHVKPVSGGLFTDVAIWVFYPFNGGARAKVEFINMSLGKLGEHFHTGNKPVVYASYPKPGSVLIGSGGGDIGVRDDTDKSDKVMDTGVRAVVVATWLNYERKWGPKIDYDVDKEIKKMKRVMIGKIKKAFERFVESIPSEMLGEDGPKVKVSWSGDETV